MIGAGNYLTRQRIESNGERQRSGSGAVVGGFQICGGEERLLADGSTADGDHRTARHSERNDHKQSEYRRGSDGDSLEKIEQQGAQFHRNHCAAVGSAKRDNDGNTYGTGVHRSKRRVSRRLWTDGEIRSGLLFWREERKFTRS